MMTDHIIRSMKDQMVPSDDVVSDLLAKISSLEASSPDTTADDSSILSFDSARFDSEIESAALAEISASRSSAKAKKHTTKSIWFYSTVAAASIILLVSSVALCNDSTNPGDLATNLVPNIVTSDEDTNLPVTDDSNPTQTDNSAGDKKDSKAESFLQKLFGKDDKQESDSDKTDSDAVNKNSDKENSGNSNSADTKKPAVTDNTGNNGNHTSDSNSSGDNKNDNVNTVAPPNPDNEDGNYVVDDDKVTPGASGIDDISFNREILADNSVATIKVLGSNYVVEQSTTSAETTSAIKSISLDLSETSVTNAATVKATVKNVANVSPDLIVAVDVDGFKQTLLYTNKDYAPDNLGQFIADAGLSSHTGFSKSAFCKGESIGYSSYRKVTVSNIKSLVSSYIFAEESALPASFSSYKSGTVHVTFTSNYNPTGSTISFGVSNNGYLYIKMASGKSFTFHIGESSASSFINSVTGK